MMQLMLFKRNIPEHLHPNEYPPPRKYLLQEVVIYSNNNATSQSTFLSSSLDLPSETVVHSLKQSQYLMMTKYNLKQLHLNFPENKISGSKFGVKNGQSRLHNCIASVVGRNLIWSPRFPPPGIYAWYNSLLLSVGGIVNMIGCHSHDQVTLYGKGDFCRCS